MRGHISLVTLSLPETSEWFLLIAANLFRHSVFGGKKPMGVSGKLIRLIPLLIITWLALWGHLHTIRPGRVYDQLSSMAFVDSYPIVMHGKGTIAHEGQDALTPSRIHREWWALQLVGNKGIPRSLASASGTRQSHVGWWGHQILLCAHVAPHHAIHQNQHITLSASQSTATTANHQQV